VLIVRVKTVSVALPDFVGSCTLVAVMVTGFVGGTEEGAV
jgi:hypothetical protein